MEMVRKQFNNKSNQLILLFILLMIIGYVVGWIQANIYGSVPLSFEYYINHALSITDAENYVKIAQNGYVTTGQDQNLIVFFPLFPLVIKGLHIVTTLDYDVCSYIISFATSCISIVLLYKIARLDYDEERSWHIGLVYIMYPVTTFLVTGLNEGIFLMLLFNTVYLVRKKKYIAAGFSGYMLALTRLPGLCVGAFMLVETIMYIIRSGKRKKFRLKILFKQCVMMLMTLMGLFTYLLINYVLHNDFFKFFEYQRSVWFQNVKNPLYVIQHTIIESQVKAGLTDVGISNLIAYIIVIIAVLYALKNKVRFSYNIYMVVYFWVCYSASWLLSGARYSLGAFVIFISLGIFVSKHKVFQNIFYFIYFLLFMFTSYLCTNCNIF